LSESGRKTAYWTDAPNLVVIFPSPGLAQGWRVSFRGILGLGLGVVFAGQLAEAFLRHEVVGAARQAAASVGLFSEKKGLRHRTLTQQGGSPVWGSQPPAPRRVVADDGVMLRRLCPVGDLYYICETRLFLLVPFKETKLKGFQRCASAYFGGRSVVRRVGKGALAACPPYFFVRLEMVGTPSSAFAPAGFAHPTSKP
jgi:hypothetical protein